MRIGIDARELCGHPTGVGRYLGGLVREWSMDDLARRHEFVLYAPEALPLPLDTRRFAVRQIPGPAGTLWEQWRLPAALTRDHLDVFFAPGYTAPLRSRVPLVVAIHDVSFAAHPEWFSTREGLRRRILSRRSAAMARAVITISAFSQREIVEHLRVPADRVFVVPPGVTSPLEGLPGSSSPPGSGQALTPPLDPHVLFVGSIFNRRHVPDLIRAFAQVSRAHPDIGLDLVGDNRSHPFEDIDRLLVEPGLSGRARWHRYVSDADLAGLYRRARAFAFLSEYEGLGLTPLEALAAGVPSVLLDTAVARESCGDAAIYVRKGDVPATANALERLLFDEETRHTLLDAAPAVLARFNWRQAARRTLEVLEHAA